MSALARLAAIGLGLGAGGAVGAAWHPAVLVGLFHIAKEEVLPSDETRLQEEGPRRRAEVRAEIARSGEHVWAGTYRTTMMWPVELTIAPEAGFTLYRHSRCGNDPNWVAIGDVASVAGATLQLGIELSEKQNTSPSWSCLDDTLHLVRWGELSFAVAEKSMEDFCAAVSDGYTFPFVPFRYLGERKDFDYAHPERPVERPHVPVAFERLLLDEPVSGRIVAMVDWRRSPGSDGKERMAYDAVYEVDVGAGDGLAVGMRLFIEGLTRWGRSCGRVEHVEPESARFQMLAFDDDGADMAGLVGRMATTRHPKATAR
jgi:hypothetical protein